MHFRQGQGVPPEGGGGIECHKELGDGHGQPQGIAPGDPGQHQDQAAADDQSPGHGHNEGRLWLHDSLEIIGGENIDIKAFQHPENSPTQNEMISSVMKNLKIIDAPKDVFYAKKFGEINDLIATYDNTEGALGYSYYYETKMLYDTDGKINNTIKILKLNGVMPDYDTIKNNDYPIISNYYLIKNKKNQSESLNIFTDAVMSDRGKNVIKEAGYIEN